MFLSASLAIACVAVAVAQPPDPTPGQDDRFQRFGQRNRNEQPAETRASGSEIRRGSTSVQGIQQQSESQKNTPQLRRFEGEQVQRRENQPALVRRTPPSDNQESQGTPAFIRRSPSSFRSDTDDDKPVVSTPGRTLQRSSDEGRTFRRATPSAGEEKTPEPAATSTRFDRSRVRITEQGEDESKPTPASTSRAFRDRVRERDQKVTVTPRIGGTPEDAGAEATKTPETTRFRDRRRVTPKAEATPRTGEQLDVTATPAGATPSPTGKPSVQDGLDRARRRQTPDTEKKPGETPSVTATPAGETPAGETPGFRRRGERMRETPAGPTPAGEATPAADRVGKIDSKRFKLPEGVIKEGKLDRAALNEARKTGKIDKQEAIKALRADRATPSELLTTVQPKTKAALIGANVADATKKLDIRNRLSRDDIETRFGKFEKKPRIELADREVDLLRRGRLPDRIREPHGDDGLVRRPLHHYDHDDHDDIDITNINININNFLPPPVYDPGRWRHDDFRWDYWDGRSHYDHDYAFNLFVNLGHTPYGGFDGAIVGGRYYSYGYGWIDGCIDYGYHRLWVPGFWSSYVVEECSPGDIWVPPVYEEVWTGWCWETIQVDGGYFVPGPAYCHLVTRYVWVPGHYQWYA